MKNSELMKKYGFNIYTNCGGPRKNKERLCWCIRVNGFKPDCMQEDAKYIIQIKKRR